MKLAFIIAMKDIKLRLRDRSAIIQAFVAPFILATIISFAFGDSQGNFKPTYAIANLDKGPIADTFIKVVDDVPQFRVVQFADKTAVRKKIDSGEASAGFVIPQGFSAAVAAPPATQGNGAGLQPHVAITVIQSPDAQIASAVGRAIAEGFAAQVDSNRLAFFTALSAAGTPNPQLLATLSQRVAAARLPIFLKDAKIGVKAIKPAAYFGPSMAIFFLFFTVQFGAKSILIEKHEGTLARLSASPARPLTIILGKAISVFFIGLASLLTLVLATSFILGAKLGDPIAVAAICIAIVFAAMCITAMVITLTKSEQQADSIGSLVVLGLTLLGGNFIPISQAPELFRKLSLLTPNGWALRSFTDLVADGGGITTILPALGAILAFGIVTGSIALIRARKLVVA